MSRARAKYHHEENHPHIFLFMIVAIVGAGVLLLGMPAQTSSLITGNSVKGFNQGLYVEQCSQDIAPVCGEDNITYRNACYAEAYGVDFYVEGECFDEFS